MDFIINIRLFYSKDFITYLQSFYLYNQMENIKRIQVLIDACTKEQEKIDQVPQSNQQSYVQIKELLKSRADMPKNFVAILIKKLSFISLKKLSSTYLTLDLIEFMTYQCDIQLYNHLATKEFVYKINAIVNHKDISNTQVYNKILNLTYCFKELFSSYKDLLPIFFEFYDNITEKGHIPNQAYISHYRNESKFQSAHSKQEEHQFNKNTEKFKQIRQKVNLVNEIINNTDPNSPIQDNALLIEMYSDVQTHKQQLKEFSENSKFLISQQVKALTADVENTKLRFQQIKSGKTPFDFVPSQVKMKQEKSVQVKKDAKQELKPVQQQFSKVKPLQQSNQKKVKKSFIDILGFQSEQKSTSKTNIADENEFKTEFHCF